MLCQCVICQGKIKVHLYGWQLHVLLKGYRQLCVKKKKKLGCLFWLIDNIVFICFKYNIWDFIRGGSQIIELISIVVLGGHFKLYFMDIKHHYFMMFYIYKYNLMLFVSKIKKRIDLSHSFHFLQTPWLWNTKECWYNYPYQVKVSQHPSPIVIQWDDLHCPKLLLVVLILTLLLCVFMQPLTVDIHYYYILELSFYLSLLFSQFTDIRRKVRMILCHTETYCMHL